MERANEGTNRRTASHLPPPSDHGYYDQCTIPVIENTARECELTERLRAAIQAYPKANAVLVRRHGVYVWGDTWQQAKTQAECYQFLFAAAVAMRRMGVDPAVGHAVTENGMANSKLNGKVPGWGEFGGGWGMGDGRGWGRGGGEVWRFRA